jgi:ADP-ribose pyrophosphatase
VHPPDSPGHFPPVASDTPGWETVRRTVHHRDPWTELAVEEVRTPTRSEPIAWTVVRRKSAAVVAPRTADGGFVLVRQERVPLRMALWEFPAGQIDETGPVDAAAIRATALRELVEETGYRLAPGADLIPLGHFFTSPGFTDEHGHLFLAERVEPDPAGHSPDHGESILEIRVFAPGELRDRIAAGEIRDANTLATFARLCARGLL